jgi:hypothetical protein
MIKKFSPINNKSKNINPKKSTYNLLKIKKINN